MKYADALAKAGIPEDRRGVISDELAVLFEVHALESEPKPVDGFKSIVATTDRLRDMIEALPPAWRLSLGTIIDRTTGAWGEPVDWLSTLELLSAQATALTRNQDGKAPKVGRPADTRLKALLFSIVLVWESATPDRGIKQDAHDSAGYSGPLLDLAYDLLTLERVQFTQPKAFGATPEQEVTRRRISLAKRLYDLTKPEREPGTVTNIKEFKPTK